MTDSPPDFDKTYFTLLTWQCWAGDHEFCSKAECMCECHEEKG